MSEAPENEHEDSRRLSNKSIVCSQGYGADSAERFVLSQMSDPELAAYEEHLLVCRLCQRWTERAEAFIRFCRLAFQAYLTQPDSRVTDRRLESRLSCHENVSVVLVDSQRQISGVLHDICRRGVGLELQSPLPVGTRIYVESARVRMSGCVRYCIEVGAGAYRVGVRLTPESLWSIECGVPEDLRVEIEHLLDVIRDPLQKE